MALFFIMSLEISPKPAYWYERFNTEGIIPCLDEINSGLPEFIMLLINNAENTHKANNTIEICIDKYSCSYVISKLHSILEKLSAQAEPIILQLSKSLNISITLKEISILHSLKEFLHCQIDSKENPNYLKLREEIREYSNPCNVKEH